MQKKYVKWISGFLTGLCFGFLLQKGGITRYNIIIGQLLLTDFTVLKTMITAIIVGMVGVYIMQSFNLVKLHAKPGSIGQTVVGGLIFGVGFAVLGYCPGTVTGAAAQGSLDALFGGMVGLLLGSGAFASVFGRLRENILKKGYFGDVTIPELLKMNKWIVITIAVVILTAVLYFIEALGY